MSNDREWLKAEHSGEDALAELMFARLVAELPPMEASAPFVDRTVQRVWQARVRRRIVTGLARVAAALLTGVATLASMYELRFLAVGLIVRGAVVVSHGLVWLLTSASEGARWWGLAERIGNVASDTITVPSIAATVAAAAMIALVAICALQHLVQEGSETRESGKVRI